MDPQTDQRILEAILCAFLAQNGGEMVLSVPAVATASALYRICPVTDRKAGTITLTLQATPDPGGAPRRRGRRPTRQPR